VAGKKRVKAVHWWLKNSGAEGVGYWAIWKGKAVDGRELAGVGGVGTAGKSTGSGTTLRDKVLNPGGQNHRRTGSNLHAMDGENCAPKYARRWQGECYETEESLANWHVLWWSINDA